MGVGTPSAWTHEQAAGAIVPLFIAGETVDWTETLRWLKHPEAQGLLDTVDTGFTAELLWSGDWRVDWHPTASAALREIHATIAQLIG